MCENKNKKKVAITTLGCKVNQFESASFISGFEAKDVDLVPFSQVADVYVINTCAVTAKAAAQSRQTIRRAIKANPAARFVVTGCYSQVAVQDILDISKVPICVVGNGFKDKLVDIALADGHCDLEMHMGDIGRKKDLCSLLVKRFGDRTRTYLKIQDGCNNFCSYCIVPFTRGRSRSLAVPEVIRQAEVFVEQGYREVVLTGIHAGVYGHDLTPKSNLLELMQRLLECQLPMRYRISSLEPAEISDTLLQLMADSAAIMPHLHIPLQSGDNGILQRMNRRYPAETFAEIVSKSAALIPHIAIGVDVLVGFPGESEAAFRNTYDLLAGLPVSYLHVFPYSKRPGTVAAAFDEQLANKIKEERVALMRDLDHKKRIAFYGQHLGQVREILVESMTKSRMMKGFTDNYIPVYFAAPKKVQNSIVKVKLERLEDGKVFGSMVENE